MYCSYWFHGDFKSHIQIAAVPTALSEFTHYSFMQVYSLHWREGYTVSTNHIYQPSLAAMVLYGNCEAY